MGIIDWIIVVVFIAWPWWCPIGALVSTAVCLSGKPQKTV